MLHSKVEQIKTFLSSPDRRRMIPWLLLMHISTKCLVQWQMADCFELFPDSSFCVGFALQLDGKAISTGPCLLYCAFPQFLKQHEAYSNYLIRIFVEWFEQKTKHSLWPYQLLLLTTFLCALIKQHFLFLILDFILLSPIFYYKHFCSWIFKNFFLHIIILWKKKKFSLSSAHDCSHFWSKLLNSSWGLRLSREQWIITTLSVYSVCLLGFCP